MPYDIDNDSEPEIARADEAVIIRSDKVVDPQRCELVSRLIKHGRSPRSLDVTRIIVESADHDRPLATISWVSLEWAGRQGGEVRLVGEPEVNANVLPCYFLRSHLSCAALASIAVIYGMDSCVQDTYVVGTYGGNLVGIDRRRIVRDLDLKLGKDKYLSHLTYDSVVPLMKRAYEWLIRPEERVVREREVLAPKHWRLVIHKPFHRHEIGAWGGELGQHHVGKVTRFVTQS